LYSVAIASPPSFRLLFWETKEFACLSEDGRAGFKKKLHSVFKKIFSVKKKYSISAGQLGRIKGLHEELKEILKKIRCP